MARMTAFVAELDSRLAGASGRRRLLLAGIAGLIAATGQSPIGLGFTTVLGLGLGLWLMQGATSVKNTAKVGWALGSGYFAGTMFWIVEPFFVDAARHAWMAPFALIFLSGGLALFWGFAFGVARWLGRSGWSLAASWVFALTGVEVARSYVLTGFPWALIGYAWTETPAIQWVQFVGSHGLTFITCTFAALFGALAVQNWLRATVAVGALCLALVMGGGVFIAPEQSVQDRPIVRLVQPNVPQDEKWDREKARGHFDRAVALTGAPSDVWPDLVVWPESSVPAWLDTAGPALDMITNAARGVPVAVGIQRREDGAFFNSMAVMVGGPAPSLVYDKHHLVPFGEYIPFRHIASRLGIRGLAVRSESGYMPGPGPEVLDFGALGQVLPLICYEAIFPHNVLGAPSRPDWMLQITNDSWFGVISGPYQHLAQARVRAIEQALPLVRVGNTGISTVIDPGGRSLGEIPLGEAGFLDLPLPSPGAPTLYAQFGDAPLIWFVALGLLAFLIARPGEVSD